MKTYSASECIDSGIEYFSAVQYAVTTIHAVELINRAQLAIVDSLSIDLVGLRQVLSARKVRLVERHHELIQFN